MCGVEDRDRKKLSSLFQPRVIVAPNPANTRPRPRAGIEGVRERATVGCAMPLRDRQNSSMVSEVSSLCGLHCSLAKAHLARRRSV